MLYVIATSAALNDPRVPEYLQQKLRPSFPDASDAELGKIAKGLLSFSQENPISFVPATVDADGAQRAAWSAKLDAALAKLPGEDQVEADAVFQVSDSGQAAQPEAASFGSTLFLRRATNLFEVYYLLPGDLPQSQPAADEPPLAFAAVPAVVSTIAQAIAGKVLEGAGTLAWNYIQENFLRVDPNPVPAYYAKIMSQIEASVGKIVIDNELTKMAATLKEIGDLVAEYNITPTPSRFEGIESRITGLVNLADTYGPDSIFHFADAAALFLSVQQQKQILAQTADEKKNIGQFIRTKATTYANRVMDMRDELINRRLQPISEHPYANAGLIIAAHGYMNPFLKLRRVEDIQEGIAPGWDVGYNPPFCCWVFQDKATDFWVFYPWYIDSSTGNGYGPAEDKLQAYRRIIKSQALTALHSDDLVEIRGSFLAIAAAQ